MTEFNINEEREVTVQRFRDLGLEGDAVEMAVAQQRGEWTFENAGELVTQND